MHIYLIGEICETNERRTRAEKPISSQKCVYKVGPNKLCISWKEFVLLAYCYWDIIGVWGRFKSHSPPQEDKEN